MVIELFSYSLSIIDIVLIAVSASLIGMAKTGIHGTGMLTVPIMAIIFGGKASSGLVLPMLIMADLFAVYYYHRHANWHYLVKLFPSAAVGVVIATIFGQFINDDVFVQIMAVIIFLSLGLMIWMEQRKRGSIPDYYWFAVLMGTLGGFTTMIGNLAGPVMALYLLSMRLPKNEYIGTAAWFFLAINLFKVPFHVFSWETITWSSVFLNIVTLPFIAVGAYLGIYLVKRISDNNYRWLVIVMTAMAALSLLI
ncbi:sulfite exporter TauE/SafE family protein [Glaciecola siphonariae]|uniref:Probable membrane transporter protein n=1 Tax=Glaciecola siphonariae TaxID=521012 RepID=A0ABV9LY19_9ALTE